MTFYLGKVKQCEHCCPPGKRGNLGSALLLTPETSQPFLPLLFCRLTSLSSYLPPSLNSLFIVTPCPFLFASLPLGTLLPLYPLFSNSTGSPWLSPRRTWRSYLFWLLSSSPVKRGNWRRSSWGLSQLDSFHLVSREGYWDADLFLNLDGRKEREIRGVSVPREAGGGIITEVIEPRPRGPSVSSVL